MDEPNYNITDSSGTVVGQIGVNGDGDPVVSKPGGGAVVVTDNGVKIPGDASVEGSFSTRQMGDNRFYAGQFSGSTPEDRLKNAAVDSGGSATIYLESADYGDVTLSTEKVTLIGPTTATFGSGSAFISGSLTLSGQESGIEKVGVGGSINLSNNGQEVRDAYVASGGSINVQSNFTNIFTSFLDGAVIFESGTKGGKIDATNVNEGSVTDNGNNDTSGV